MGLFSKWNRRQQQERQRRLAELDRKNRAAAEGLAREIARGAVIGWENDFARLGRLIESWPSANDADFQALVIAKTLGECASFRSSHCGRANELAVAAIIEAEDAMEGRIEEVAAECGFVHGSVEDALASIACAGRIGALVAFASQLADILS